MAFPFTVATDEADEVRSILAAHLPAGIRFTERRSWWLWVKFTITGDGKALRRIQTALNDWRDARIMENWP